MKKRGFTLIELLIASAIFAVIMVAIYSAFSSGLFGSRNIEENVNAYQSARIILEEINTDLRNSFAYSDEDAKFSGSPTQFSFFALTGTFSKGRMAPEFSTISYSLEQDKLMRLCRKNTDALDEVSETEAEEMASGVEAVFKYGKSLNENDEMEFVDSWPDTSSGAENKNVMPLAVKVTLTVKGKTGQSFERTVYLPASI